MKRAIGGVAKAPQSVVLGTLHLSLGGEAAFSLGALLLCLLKYFLPLSSLHVVCLCDQRAPPLLVKKLQLRW